ncbi:Hypp4951 [Branchiostoma lanceolatum]|uniref:Hypp4951 protein n=1 Tax=Branchiostoma lanceolatum TaxID=7740 RepID=A0A8K0ACL2_BRALA|nr:Hypp4951 [Branchiostoma lanceolatum]
MFSYVTGHVYDDDGCFFASEDHWEGCPPLQAPMWPCSPILDLHALLQVRHGCTVNHQSAKPRLSIFVSKVHTRYSPSRGFDREG